METAEARMVAVGMAGVGWWLLAWQGCLWLTGGDTGVSNGVDGCLEGQGA